MVKLLGELAVSIIRSAVYDSLKAGLRYIKRDIFEESVHSKTGKGSISSDEFNELYIVANDILNELQSQQRNSFTKEEFLAIIRKYLPPNNKEFEQKIYNIALQKAECYYDDSNYDKAIKFYDEAELYQNSEEEYSYILWKKFLCYLNIENYYQYIVDYKGTYCDLQKIYNYCDYNISKTVSTISSQLRVSKIDSERILNYMLNKRECSLVKRKFAIKESQFNIGLRALELTVSNDLRQNRLNILDNCLIIS